MSDAQSLVEQIRASAAHVVSVAAQLGAEIGYNESGVRWLDEFIQNEHENGNPDHREGLVAPLGAFLGECIIHRYGGEWANVDGSWCIEFAKGKEAYPLTKVGKQLVHGEEDSVLGFFHMLPIVFPLGGKLAEPGAAPDTAG